MPGEAMVLAEGTPVGTLVPYTMAQPVPGGIRDFEYPAVAGNIQNLRGIRDLVYPVFDPGIIPQPPQGGRLPGEAMVLAEGPPVGTLVPYAMAQPVPGNRAIYFNNTTREFYHVVWAAVRTNPDTGEVEPAAWGAYSV